MILHGLNLMHNRVLSDLAKNCMMRYLLQDSKMVIFSILRAEIFNVIRSETFVKSHRQKHFFGVILSVMNAFFDAIDNIKIQEHEVATTVDVGLAGTSNETALVEGYQCFQNKYMDFLWPMAVALKGLEEDAYLISMKGTHALIKK